MNFIHMMLLEFPIRKMILKNVFGIMPILVRFTKYHKIYSLFMKVNLIEKYHVLTKLKPGFDLQSMRTWKLSKKEITCVCCNVELEKDEAFLCTECETKLAYGEI